MIEFVIYEDEKQFRKRYVSVISKILANKKLAYKITELEHYDKDKLKEINKRTGKKIYILDIEVPGKNGLHLVKSILNSESIFSEKRIIDKEYYVAELNINLEKIKATKR